MKKDATDRAKPGHFIGEWRVFRGRTLPGGKLTQECLAEKAGLSTSSISQYESGKQGYSQASLEALAAALSCRPGDLLTINPLDPNAPWSLLAELSTESRRKVEDYIRDLARAEKSVAA